MDPIANPYRPGAGTAPPELAGRDGLLREFGVALARAKDGRPGKSLMPNGLRGVGKTVLLNRFRADAVALNFSTIFIEAQEASGFSLAATLVNRVRRVLLAAEQRGVSGVVHRALRILKSFSLSVNPAGEVSLGLDVDAERGIADSGDLTEDLADVLVSVGQAAGEQQSGLLLAIDEVQYLSREQLGALIGAVHRTTQENLPVVLVGAGLPQLPGLAGEAKSYAERLFDFPRIGSLSNEDANRALREPARAAGADFTEDAIDVIIERTKGYPYFLQEWAYHAWNRAARAPIEADDARAAERAVLQRLDDNFFAVRLDRLTPGERRYLRAMASLGPGPHASSAIAQELGVRINSASPTRSTLIRKGMVYAPEHGSTAFTVPLFDQFLRRAVSDEE